MSIRKVARTHLFFLAAVLLLLDAGAAVEPWAENAWYWSANNKPVLLLGGSDDDNLFQWPKAELIEHLDRVASAGANVIRNTMSDRPDRGWEIYPYIRLNDGSYDLNEWNEDYWERFETMLLETERRGIFVQIEVWDRFDYTDRNKANFWQRHPFNPANNRNYTFEESGFEKHYLEHPGMNVQPFFFTTPVQRNNGTVLHYQKRFVDRLLDHTLRYDHVLYCIDNETNGEEAWSFYWATFIKSRAARESRKLYVTEMWDDWDLSDPEHKRTFDYPDLYDFVDVSQNNHNKGQKHWDNFLIVREYLSGHPRPMNTTKTYGADGNRFGHTDQDAIERFWRHLLAGVASARFHRPPAGLGINEKAFRCIRAAREVEERVSFWTVEPSNHLLSERSENEAYLASAAGQAYVLYFPGKGSVLLDLRETQEVFQLHWTSVDAREPMPVESIVGGKWTRIDAPSSGGWVATLVR